MGAVSNFFAQFDLFEAPAFLRINKQDKMKSFPVGLASFLIACFFVYVSVVSCISILNYQSIESTMQDTFIPQETARGEIEIFAIGINNLTKAEIDTMFNIQVRFYKNRSDLPSPSYTVPCQHQMWKGLGDDYVAKFQEYQLNRFYCLNMTQPFLLKQTVTSLSSTIIAIFISICVPWPLPTICDMAKAKKYIKQVNLQINIRALDNGFTPQQKISTYRFVNTDHKIYVSSGIRQDIELFYSIYRVQTDKSLVSFQDDEIQEGIHLSDMKSYIASFDMTSYFPIVGKVSVSMNNRLRVYKRTIGKLDNLLSYLGGLFQMLIGFIAFFIASFNEYRYEIKASEGMFKYIENRKQLKQSDFTLLRFVQYGFYDWVNTLFCTELKWKFCNQVDEVREEVVSQMEVNRVYKRIRNAETAVGHVLGDNTKGVIKVLEPPTLQKVKQRRLNLDYSRAMLEKQVEMSAKQQKQQKRRLTQKAKNQQKNNEIESKDVIDRRDNQKLMIDSIILSSDLQKAEIDLANSLFLVKSEFRSQLEDHISPMVLYRLKLRKQKQIKLTEQ